MQRIVLGYLSEQLSKYLLGFKKEHLNLNLATGRGEISNVELNVQVINDQFTSKLAPTIEIQSIHISKLCINVTSFKNIRKAPILLMVDDVSIHVIEALNYIPKKKYENSGVGARRGRYGIADRIADNISLQVNRIHITFQPLGKFKTRRIGVWTPPSLSIQINHLNYTSVDEFGTEGTPDEVWRHNTSRHTIKIYKKLSLDITLKLKHKKYYPLLQEGQVDIHYCFHKRLYDAALLALQVDVSLMDMEIELNGDVIPLCFSFVVALLHLVCKDRSFDDLLYGNDEGDNVEVLSPSKIAIHETNMEDSEILSNIDEDFDEESFEEESFEEESFKLSQNENTPLLSLRGGFNIWEKLIFSLSIHDFSLRAFYGNEDSSDGCIQFILKGLVLDAMSCKEYTLNNGIVQLSLPYFILQEKYKTMYKPLILGGIYLKEKKDSDLMKTMFEEVDQDEHFPLFEYAIRIREDFTSTKNFLPIQAVGYKATIRLKDDSAGATMEDNMILNELGMNKIAVMLDMVCWCRVMRFFLNEDNGGFDGRWYSGQWQSEITSDMIRRREFSMEACLQPLPKPAKPKNIVLSTTARFTAISLNIPANDVYGSNLSIKLDEIMINISSALPKTFLVGRIAGQKVEDRATKLTFCDIVDFPNDPTDLCYLTQTTDNSTRIQISISSFSITIEPILFRAKELLPPTKITMLLSIENDIAFEKELITQFYFSLIVHTLDVHLDLEIMGGLIQTLVFHHQVFLDNYPKRKEPTMRRSKSYPSFKKKSILKRQISMLSRKGSWMFIFCMHLPDANLHIWIRKKDAIPLIRLQVEELELGFESFFKSDNDLKESNEEMVLKFCCKEMQVKLLDYDGYRSNEDKCEKVPMITVLSLGREESGVALRYQTSQSILLSLELNGALVNVPMKCIETCLNLVMDTLLLPCQGPKHSNIFPAHSIGALFESLSKKVSFKSKEPFANKDLYLISSKIKNASITIQESNTNISFPFSKAFFVNLKTTPVPSNSSRILFTQLARCDPNWLESFNEHEVGYHLLLDSTLLEEKDVALHIRMKPSCMDTSVENVRYLLDCFGDIEAVKCVMHGVVDDFVRIQHRMRCRLNLPPQREWDDKEHLLEKYKEQSESSSMKLLSKLKSILFKPEKIPNSIVVQKNKDLCELRTQLFLKERERVAAVSLLSMRKCGWVRFGSVRLSGQRLVKSASCHQYWLILNRDNVIVVTKEPGQTKPLNFIDLNGAQLQSLNWGNRNTGTKRGFVIIDSCGRESVLLFRNGRELDDWLKDIGQIVEFTIVDEIIDDSILGHSVQDSSNLEGNSQRSTMYLRDKMVTMSSQVKSSMANVVDRTSSKKILIDNNSMDQVVDTSKDSLAFTNATNPHDTDTFVEKQVDSELADSSEAISTNQERQTDSFSSNTQTTVHDKLLHAKANMMKLNLPSMKAGNSVTSSTNFRNKVSFKANSKFLKQASEDAGSFSKRISSLSFKSSPSVIKSSSSEEGIFVSSNEKDIEDSALGEDLNKEEHQNITETKESLEGSSTDKIHATEKNLNESSLDEIQNQAHGYFDVWESTPSFKSPNKGQHNVFDRMSSFKISAKQSMNVAMKSVTPDVNALNIINSGNLRNTTKPDADGHAQHSNIMERMSSMKLSAKHSMQDAMKSITHDTKQPSDMKGHAHQHNILDKMSSMKTSAKQSMQVAVKSIAPDVSALKLLDSGALNATQAPSSDISLSKLQSASMFSGHMGDVFSTDKEKKPVKLSNISVGTENLDRFPPKLNQVDLEMSNDLINWFARVSPLIIVGNKEASDAQQSDAHSNGQPDLEDKDSVQQESPPSTSKESDSQFLVTIFKYDMKIEDDLRERPPVKKVIKNISHFLALHANLSMIISDIPVETFSSENSDSELPKKLEISLKEQIDVVGNILMGALDCSSDEKNKTTIYQCNILRQFLHLFVGSPMPKIICEKVIDFLDIKKFLDDDELEQEPFKESSCIDKMESPTQFDEAFDIVTALESELIRSEQSNKSLLQNVQDVSMTTTNCDTGSSHVKPLKESKANSNSLFHSMQNSLLKAMSERDEAYSQLIGASVLHSYLMQQERKKAERFAAKLNCLENILAANNNNPINTRRKDNEMIQDNETELLSLCRQLSSEIAGKTSATLELARLKECFDLEREHQAAEKVKLMEQLNNYEELLMKEKSKCEEAKKEASHWKQIYEKNCY